MAKIQLITVALISSLCVLVPLASASSPKFDYCDKGSESSSDVKVIGLEVTPYPVRAGDPATFIIAASTDKSISSGKLAIDVYYFGVCLHSETHDICSKTTCPISPGDFKISHSQQLPRLTPAGSYRLKMSMTDGKNKLLTCIRFNIRIQWGADAVAES